MTGRRGAGTFAGVNRPVLMTVDDDPGVSRAVARDLRRRYGQEFRVVRADSGREALDALREIKLRGDAGRGDARRLPDAADERHRVPRRGHGPAPHARRALLTAYADTDAAIQAINVVDVDHYLLKPWDPPEEKLYPVVDALVETWRADGQRPVEEIGWSGTAGRPSASGARLPGPQLRPVPLVLRRRAGGRAAARGRRRGAGRHPGGRHARRHRPAPPERAEIAAAVGLTTEPASEFYDLIVVGGGPAGLGAAVYGASEGLRTVLVEREATGGQAGQSSRIENYLGFPDGVSGGQLTDRARRQAAKFGAEVLTARDVVALEARGSARVVRFGDGTEIAAHAVVLATGVSYRSLDAPGVGELTGRGVFYGSAATEAPACAGEDVYIVGGANSAGQAAVFFSRHARSVTILVRGASWRRRCRLPDRAARRRSTTSSSAPARGRRGPRRRAPRAAHARRPRHRRGGDRRRRAMFVFIGAAPRTDWLGGAIVRDERGFIRPGPTCSSTGGGRPAGRWTATRTTWRPACPACSSPATCGRSRSNGSPRRSARARWR